VKFYNDEKNENSCNGIVEDGIYTLWHNSNNTKMYINEDFTIGGHDSSRLKVNLTSEFDVIKEKFSSNLNYFTKNIEISKQDLVGYLDIESFDIYVRLESISPLPNDSNQYEEEYQKYIIRVIHFRSTFLLALTNDENTPKLELMRQYDDNKQFTGNEQLFILELMLNDDQDLEVNNDTNTKPLLNEIKKLFIQRIKNSENTQATPEYRIYHDNKRDVLHFEEIPIFSNFKVLKKKEGKTYDNLGLDSFVFHFENKNNYINFSDDEGSEKLCQIKFSDSFIAFHKDSNPVYYADLENNSGINWWLSRSNKASNSGIPGEYKYFSPVGYIIDTYDGYYAGIRLHNIGKNELIDSENPNALWKIQKTTLRTDDPHNKYAYRLRFYWDGEGEHWRRMTYRGDDLTVWNTKRSVKDTKFIIMPVISHLLWKRTNKPVNYTENYDINKEQMNFYFDYQQFKDYADVNVNDDANAYVNVNANPNAYQNVNVNANANANNGIGWYEPGNFTGGEGEVLADFGK
jgi:hypothetical protein